VSEPLPPGDADALTRAQEDLARALGRARIGEDRALFDLVRELGERLAYLLSGLLRMTRTHSPDNRAFDQPVGELHRTLVRLHETLGPIHLVAIEDQVYVNDGRIRTGDKETAIHELGGELERHNVGELTFHEPLDDAGIRTLVGALGEEPAGEQPRAALGRALNARGLRGLELHGRFRFRMVGGTTSEVVERQDLVPRALALIDEAYQNLFAGRVPNPLPLRRLVTELLESDLGTEDLWLEPPTAPPLALHLFRVAHISLLIGREAGLSDEVTQDLGVAALYHDCGYAAPRPEGAVGEISFEAHPREGARLLMHQRGFHEAKTRRVLVALQHHQDANARPRPGLFARIVRIAEDYDTLTRRQTLAPTVALAKMLKAAGTLYDTVLLQLAVNALGAYPPGTLLRLEDGTVVRVATASRGPDTFAKPLARPLQLADGSAAPADWPLLDLKDVGSVTLVQPQS
jgi:hypothetical protein